MTAIKLIGFKSCPLNQNREYICKTKHDGSSQGIWLPEDREIVRETETCAGLKYFLQICSVKLSPCEYHSV